MADRSVVVRGVRFPSKAALERHCRGIVEKHSSGEMMAAEDAMFFLSLILERHERPHEKIMVGLEDEVVGVRVRHADGYAFYGESKTNVNHTFVVYACGREIDFSWKKCCSGFKKEHIATTAMRRAVADQVAAYKKLRFAAGSGSVTSDVSGDPLVWGDACVDHYPMTFAALRDRFLSLEGIPLGDVEVASDPRCGAAMADEWLRRRWASYHDAHKTLRLVSAKENETSWRDEGAVRNGL